MNICPATPATAPDAPHPAAVFAARLDTTLASTLLMLAAQFRLLGAFTGPVWTRFSRARVRLHRLLTALAEGRFRPARPRAPGPARKGGPPAPYSPRGRLWLVRKLGYHAVGFGSQLTHLLQDPATLALLATAPPAALAAMGRTLRPLCHLLGTELPPALQRSTPDEPLAGRAKSAKPKPAPLPPLLPLYPQRRPRLILYPDPPRKTRPA